MEMSDDDVDWILTVNLHGVMNTTRAFLPGMIAAGGGHICATASMAGLLPGWIPVHVPYSAAKAGPRDPVRPEAPAPVVQGAAPVVAGVPVAGVPVAVEAGVAEVAGAPLAGRARAGPADRVPHRRAGPRRAPRVRVPTPGAGPTRTGGRCSREASPCSWPRPRWRGGGPGDRRPCKDRSRGARGFSVASKTSDAPKADRAEATRLPCSTPLPSKPRPSPTRASSS